MNHTAGQTRNKGPSMLPALHLNGLAGFVPSIGIKNKNFNCCLSIHQKAFPIVYFHTKPEGLLKTLSNFRSYEEI